jgi:hypothetical protein
MHWYPVKAFPFDECILMRYKHASCHVSLSEKDFVPTNLEQETELVARFGNFAVEAVWLDEALHGISMYCDDAVTGIRGVCVHTSLRTYHVGRDDAMVKFFPLHGPGEVLTEIEVRTRSRFSPPAITVRLHSPEPSWSVSAHGLED